MVEQEVLGVGWVGGGLDEKQLPHDGGVWMGILALLCSRPGLCRRPGYGGDAGKMGGGAL